MQITKLLDTELLIRKERSLTSILRLSLERSAAEIFAIKAKIIAERIVRLEIRILEPSRYRISVCYLFAFFRRNSSLAIATTCVTNQNDVSISVTVISSEVVRFDRSVYIPAIHRRVASERDMVTRRMLTIRRSRFHVVPLLQKQIPQCHVPGWAFH